MRRAVRMTRQAISPRLAMSRVWNISWRSRCAALPLPGMERFATPAPFHAAPTITISTAMLYLIAIFCSPLALLLAGKPFQALFNLVLYLVSVVLWITIVFHHGGFILWLVAFLHAV